MIALRNIAFMLATVVGLGYALLAWTWIAFVASGWSLESPAVLIPAAVGTSFIAGVALTCIASIFRVKLRPSELKGMASFAAAGILLMPIVATVALAGIWLYG
jgi:hypothetical protein